MHRDPNSLIIARSAPSHSISVVSAVLFITATLLLHLGCDQSSSPSSSSQLGASPPTTQVTPLEKREARELTPLCEFDGRIETIFMHAPDGLVGRVAKPAYDLLNALPSGVRFTFACNTRAAVMEMQGRLKQWDSFARHKISLLMSEGPLSVWSRDRYIAVRSTDGILGWLIPRVAPNADANRREKDRRVPMSIGSIADGMFVAETPLILEGGNLLASRKQVFIGASIFKDNKDLGGPDQVKADLAKLFAMPVVIVADQAGETPIAHIDMYLTVLADDHVLVGSPTLASETIKNADEGSRSELHERLFDLPDQKGDEPDFSSERAAAFDQIADSLAKQGLRVSRIPYVDSRKGDFIVTYNNVLQEQRDGRHIVYMPTYAIPALDTVARKVYEGLGCEVVPIDVSPISHKLGAVRCLANVAERSTGDAP